MRTWSRNVVVMAAVWLVVGAAASPPVRRTPDLEARRRSAINRNMIRLGRSYPAEPSAADIREALQRPVRRNSNFLRFGRSQPVAFSSDDLISLLRSYEDDYDTPFSKRSTHFIRLGRDPKFIRLGRSSEDDKTGEQTAELVLSGYPQRKSRARDQFLRLGRDSEELGDVDDETMEERRKRSTEAVCDNCQS